MKPYWQVVLVFLSTLATSVVTQDDVGVYKIGVGISDITGPPTGMVLVRKKDGLI